jgi:hypothetical protein
LVRKIELTWPKSSNASSNAVTICGRRPFAHVNWNHTAIVVRYYCGAYHISNTAAAISDADRKTEQWKPLILWTHTVEEEYEVKVKLKFCPSSGVNIKASTKRQNLTTRCIHHLDNHLKTRRRQVEDCVCLDPCQVVIWT